MSNDTPVQWYLGIDNEASDPMGLSEVAALFASGKANRLTPVWTHGMGDWAEAGAIDALQAFLVQPTPQGPPALPARADALSDTLSAEDGKASAKDTGPKAAPAVQAASAPAAETAPVLHEDMPFEELIVALGLTMEQVQNMASNAVEIAGHAKTSLKLGPPHRFGLFQSF